MGGSLLVRFLVLVVDANNDVLVLCKVGLVVADLVVVVDGVDVSCDGAT